MNFSVFFFLSIAGPTKIVAPAKSCLHAAELINFNKGEAIIAQTVGSSSNAPAKTITTPRFQ